MQFTTVASGVALAVLLSLSANSQAKLSFSADYTGTGDADIDGQSSSLRTHSYGFNVGYDFIDFTARRTTYDFSGVESDPFDELTKLQITLHHKGNITSNISYLASLGLGALYEDDLDLSESYNVSPTLALGWNFTNGMTAFVGATANLNPADNVYLPVIGLQLGEDKDKGWTGAIAYPATRVQYRFNPTLAVNATFLTVRDTYHLDDDKSKGNWADGYFREESYGASFGATVTPIQHLTFSVGVNTYFNRQFKVYDNDGNKIESFDTDPTYGGYFNVNYSF